MRANKNVATREVGPSLLKDLTSGFTRQSVLSTPGIRTANPYENTRQPRPPRLTPLIHPQPVSPLQQQRPLVGDGLRLCGVWWVGDKFLFVPRKDRAALAAHGSAFTCAARGSRAPTSPCISAERGPHWTLRHKIWDSVDASRDNTPKTLKPAIDLLPFPR